MTSPLSAPFALRASALAAAMCLAAALTHAQSDTSSNLSSAGITPAYSSSQTGLNQTELAEFAAPALPGASRAAGGSASAGGQYGSSGGHGYHSMFHHWTYEVGAGANAPVGNDTPYITWGGNFTVGGGLRLNRYVSALAEYQFMDNKLPGALLSAFQVPAGNSHINSITGSPVIDLFPKKSNGIYLVGGWGWYHKSTNLQNYECCDIYGDVVTVTVGSFSSNQWGGNGGLGLYHRFSNVYGDTNHTEFFAEARYTYIHTPPITQQNSFGTTELIPFQLGVRF